MKSRVSLWLLALIALSVIVACGHKSDAPLPPANVRVVNATKSAVVSLTATNTATGSTAVVVNSNVNAGGAGSYSPVAVGSTSFVASAANGSLSASPAQLASLETAVNYTFVAYERNGAINIILITDSQTTPPATGFAFFNIGNPAPDAGPLDIYLVPPGTTVLDNLNPNYQNAFSGGLSIVQSITAGTYDIVVTAYNKPTDLRARLSNVKLVDQEIATLMLTGTSGGALVDATLVQQGGAVTSYPNAFARIRLMGTITSSSAPLVAVNAVGPAGSSSTYPFSFVSPNLDNLYTIVEAGTTIQSVSVNSAAVTAPTDVLAAGGDYTLMVYGTSAAPSAALLTDNNQAPNSAKIRLINTAVPPSAGDLGVISLTDNNVTLFSQIPYGNASAYSGVNTGTSVLTATSPDQTFPGYTTTVNVALGGVYSLVMAGTNAAPVTQFVRDR